MRHSLESVLSTEAARGDTTPVSQVSDRECGDPIALIGSASSRQLQLSTLGDRRGQAGMIKFYLRISWRRGA